MALERGLRPPAAPARFVLLALVMLGAGGCAKHAVDAVKDMRARACAGDAAGFFAHVDRDGLVQAARAGAEKKAEASLAELDPAAQAAARQKLPDRVERVAQTSVSDTFTTWRYEIGRGPAGDLCRMSIMESSEADHTADVHVKDPADFHWKMARRGDRWLLVRVD
ncbi:MAG TPA: hypothetical protein VHL80_04850 [Polyangia bacterium]|nr:hypothetical protein [Polyangia bacterium]